MSGAQARMADAMLRVAGAEMVALRVPVAAVPGDDAEQLGQATPEFQDMALGPVVWRKARGPGAVSGCGGRGGGRRPAGDRECCRRGGAGGGRGVSRGGAGCGGAGGLITDCPVSSFAFETLLRRGEGWMQGIKDAFYRMLRDRVAAGNAGRTVVVRGVERPGVVTVENELPSAIAGVFAPEVFCLEWTGAAAIRRSDVPLWQLRCVVRYASDGTVNGGGMDRGRALAAMDAELVTALSAYPTLAAKVPADGTNIFWGEPALGAANLKAERLERMATVEVFGYE